MIFHILFSATLIFLWVWEPFRSSGLVVKVCKFRGWREWKTMDDFVI